MRHHGSWADKTQREDLCLSSKITGISRDFLFLGRRWGLSLTQNTADDGFPRQACCLMGDAMWNSCSNLTPVSFVWQLHVRLTFQWYWRNGRSWYAHVLMKMKKKCPIKRYFDYFETCEMCYYGQFHNSVGLRMAYKRKRKIMVNSFKEHGTINIKIIVATQCITFKYLASVTSSA